MDNKNNNDENIDFWLNELRKFDGIIDLSKDSDSENENRSFLLNSEEKMKEIKSYRHIYQIDTDTAWKKLSSRFEQDGLLPQEPNDTQFRIKKFWSIAAGFALLVTLSVLLYFYSQQDNNEYISVFADTKSGIRSVNLPDGTVVSLNIGGQIKYPKRFFIKSRNVEFSGEAFFNVAKNKKHPFIISTKNSKIKVVGTAFNLIASTLKTEVAVTEGHVQLYATDSKTKKLDLLPGDVGLFQNKRISVSKNNDPNYSSWFTKKITIAPNMNLAELTECLKKVYHTNIEFEQAEIGNIMPSPTVFDNYSLNTILTILCTQSSLKSKTENGKIILSFDN